MFPTLELPKSGSRVGTNPGSLSAVTAPRIVTLKIIHEYVKMSKWTHAGLVPF